MYVEYVINTFSRCRCHEGKSLESEGFEERVEMLLFVRLRYGGDVEMYG